MRYQKQMSKIYFVDSEKRRWCLDRPFTGRSKRHVPDFLHQSLTPHWLWACHRSDECQKQAQVHSMLRRQQCTGFSISILSWLSAPLKKHRWNVIVSNDTGFDAVVHFWSEQNRAITRLTSSNIPTPEIKTEPTPVSEEKATPSSSVDTDTEQTVSGVDLKELYTIINCVSSKESSYIHLAYVHFYGIKKGEDSL